LFYFSLPLQNNFVPKQNMRIIIFGSTGSIGQQLVAQALESGYSVTAFVRNAEKLKAIQNKNLQLSQGDVLNYFSVLEAVKGHDAVLCSLGAGRKGIVRSKGTENIINSMKQSGIRRLICQSTLGAGDSIGNLNFFWKQIMFRWVLKEALVDHELQEQHVMSSHLDWTIVRPGAFINGNATANFHHGFDSTDKSIKLKISRADVAFFMLKQLQTNTYLRKTPGLSY